MSDDLVVNQPRIGWFYDGDESTPATATLLQDTGEEITLTIPWVEEGGKSGAYARWFYGPNVIVGDDRDRTRYSYSVPPVLHFQDSDGLVALVGCRSRGGRSPMGRGAGHGVVGVQFAVVGAGPYDYGEIHGLRSQMPALADWVGLKSLTTTYDLHPDNRLRSLDLHLESPPPLALARSLNLRLRPNFQSGPAGPGVTEVREMLQAETRVARARPWVDHLRVHNTVRDILDIASWRPTGTQELWALRDDDPMKVMSGDAVGEQWHTVKTYVTRKYEPQSRVRFLFAFDDVGTSGFKRWATLRRQFERGLTPILAYFNHPGMPVESLMVQTNIGFEAIGYRLAVEAGKSPGGANREHHDARLQRIAAALPVVPPFDVEDWVMRATDAYNGFKHAHRDLPDTMESYRTLIESWLVFRLWVAGRIGVTPETLERRRATDYLWRRCEDLNT